MYLSAKKDGFQYGTPNLLDFISNGPCITGAVPEGYRVRGPAQTGHALPFREQRMTISTDMVEDQTYSMNLWVDQLSRSDFEQW